jgi:hypothetical protein
MNHPNLPAGCTQDMVDAQCSPLSTNMEECFDCGDFYSATDMFPWEKYRNSQHSIRVYICADCVKQSYSCLWLHNENGHVNLDLKPCGRIQSPTAQGPWCAEHDKESMKLDESEEANGL